MCVCMHVHMYVCVCACAHMCVACMGPACSWRGAYLVLVSMSPGEMRWAFSGKLLPSPSQLQAKLKRGRSGGSLQSV